MMAGFTGREEKWQTIEFPVLLILEVKWKAVVSEAVIDSDLIFGIIYLG